MSSQGAGPEASTDIAVDFGFRMAGHGTVMHWARSTWPLLAVFQSRGRVRAMTDPLKVLPLLGKRHLRSASNVSVVNLG